MNDSVKSDKNEWKTRSKSVVKDSQRSCVILHGNGEVKYLILQ
jgi:hypothetical protein